MVVAPSNNNVIYAATSNAIHKTTNGGGNWTNITIGLPSNAITYVSVHDLNPNFIWVSLSGFSNGNKVYKSVDGGNSWINVSGNLPNLPINCVVYENGSNNGIYVGTDMGIYYKNDDLSLWQSYTAGLPNVIVNELEIHYGAGKIRAATYGRGLWESDLFVTAQPTAQFFSPDTSICPGNCSRFTNTTPNLGLQWQWYFPGGTPSTSTALNPIICYPANGSYHVSLVVSNPIGTDSVYAANYIVVQNPQIGSPPPLTEDFQSINSIPAGWSIINDDNDVTWKHSSSVGGFGQSSSSIFLDNYSTNFKGKRDYLVSPLLDFSNVVNSEITFDVAHVQWSSARSDTLAIYYSLDCGVTRNLLWEKGSSELTTLTNYYPLFFTPTPNEWRNDTINLNALSGLSSVVLLFENKSDDGNVIYLDNINLQHVFGVGLEEHHDNDLTVYPNPFINTLTIKNSAPINHIEIYNSIGKLVLSKSVHSTSTQHVLNLNYFTSGFYLIKVSSDQGIITKNLIKH